MITYAAIACSEPGRFVGGPMSCEEAWYGFNELVAGWLLRGHGLWSVETRDGTQLLGFLPLAHEIGDPEPELGWPLCEAAEGKGYATEAALAARDFAFGRLGGKALVSYLDPGNARSQSVAERLGARRDATSRHPEDDNTLICRHPGSEALT